MVALEGMFGDPGEERRSVPAKAPLAKEHPHFFGGHGALERVRHDLERFPRLVLNVIPGPRVWIEVGETRCDVYVLCKIARARATRYGEA